MPQIDDPNNSEPTDQERDTFLRVLMEGYYWGLLRRVEGEELAEYLRKRESTREGIDRTLNT